MTSQIRGHRRTRERNCWTASPRRNSARTSWRRCKSSSDAEQSDLFDVLAYVAFALPKLTREERAHHAQAAIRERFDSKQQAFLDFVLGHYVSDGVEELDQDKLTPLLRLKYHDSITDAFADLGEPEEIGKAFTGFQKYLYEQQAGV